MILCVTKSGQTWIHQFKTWNKLEKLLITPTGRQAGRQTGREAEREGGRAGGKHRGCATEREANRGWEAERQGGREGERELF